MLFCYENMKKTEGLVWLLVVLLVSCSTEKLSNKPAPFTKHRKINPTLDFDKSSGLMEAKRKRKHDKIKSFWSENFIVIDSLDLL